MSMDVDQREVLRQSIERDEAELRDAMDELTLAVKKELTLGTQIASHPVPWLVGGFLLGVWLAQGD